MFVAKNCNFVILCGNYVVFVYFGGVSRGWARNTETKGKICFKLSCRCNFAESCYNDIIVYTQNVLICKQIVYCKLFMNA